MGSKLWLGLLHDPSYRRLLDDHMTTAIDYMIPYSIVLDEQNIEKILENKDSYFFKAAGDFGGHGVIPGKSTSPNEIRDRLGDLKTSKWIAQKSCEIQPIKIRPICEDSEFEANSVLGLYQIDGRWSGALVRAQKNADVINVAGGSTIGWGYEVKTL